MKYIFCILFLFTVFVCLSQGQLQNKYSSWHEVHGGVEGSGVSRTESYIFVASKTVKLKDIYFQDVEITLKAKDTLIVQVYSHRYDSTDPMNDTENLKLNQPDLKKRFQVIKKNHTFLATVVYPYDWPKKIEYVYKKKTYTAQTKKEFDKGESAYAP